MKKIGNSSIFYEKYKPQCIEDLVLPDELKNRLIQMSKNRDFPSIGLFSSEPGCVLPGTRIIAQAEEKWIDCCKIKEKYNLTKYQYNILLKYCEHKRIDNNILIDENTVTKNLLIICQNMSKRDKTYDEDKKYENKHLKLDYWISKYNDYNKAKKKVNTLRYNRKYFIDIEKLNDGYTYKFNEKNLKETLLKIQFKMIYNEFNTIKELFPFIDSPWSIDFWLFRGWSEEESLIKISELQKDNYKRREEKYTKEELRKQRGYGQSVEKFINLGYSEEEAKILLKERQATFSLEKCIAKHGEVEGKRIFDERQIKWQNTLDSKSQEEKDAINKSKSITLDNMVMKYGLIGGRERYYKWCSSTNPGILNKTYIHNPGKLYYIHFYNDEIEFWKIGITKLEVVGGRFEREQNFYNKYKLNYKVIFINEYPTYLECYEKEQYILSRFSKYGVSINYNGFQTSEAFDINILKEFYETI